MKTPPPRRNYAQMVRVVRDEPHQQYSASVPYQLAKAYGAPASSGVDTRIRSLDEIGINTRPVNQLQSPALSSYYNSRESSILFHQLSEDQQQYFTGTSPNPAPTRMDAWPGTKTRAYLDSTALAEKINVSNRRADHTPSGSASPKQTINSKETVDDSEFKKTPVSSTSEPKLSPMAEKTDYKKQTRLPYVSRANMDGISGASVDVSTSFND